MPILGSGRYPHLHILYPCPDAGCCCDHGKSCCDLNGGNTDHLGERGGCKKLDPSAVPGDQFIGPRRECGFHLCRWCCGWYIRHGKRCEHAHPDD